MTGLSCARKLHNRGLQVQVFEKSRGLGGRIATRRRNGFQFDHGAQYMMARSGPFSEYLLQVKHQNIAAVWSPRSANGKDVGKGEHTEWTVGVPGMSVLVRPLAAELNIMHGVQIQSLARHGPDWTLVDAEAQRYGPFQAVVVTAPAPQTRVLLAPVDPQFEALSDIAIAPCWAGLFAFETSLNNSFDTRREAGASIAWGARDNSKPGRRDRPETWVVHASADWSQRYLEHDKQDIARHLLDEFKGFTGLSDLTAIISAEAHRWRYALVEKPLGQPFMQSDDGTLFAAGDWCLAPRVEAAYESGVATAEALCKAMQE